jgi:hypothetical protein
MKVTIIIDEITDESSFYKKYKVSCQKTALQFEKLGKRLA